MNPAWSFACTHVLPSTSVPYARTNASVSSDVVTDGVSSSSAMTGGGLKKCIPITRSGRPDAMPSSTIGIDDVLLARMTSGLVTSPSVRKISAFASTSSVAASITRSDASRPARSVTPDTRPKSASASEVSSLPRSTALATDRFTDARPRATSSSVPSTNVTAAPERATTSTMPEPIRPQPTTPTCRTSRGSTVFRPPIAVRAQAYNPGHERSSQAGHARGRRGRRAGRSLAHLPGRGAGRRLARHDPASDRSLLPRVGERHRTGRRPCRPGLHVHRAAHDPGAFPTLPRGHRPGRAVPGVRVHRDGGAGTRDRGIPRSPS